MRLALFILTLMYSGSLFGQSETLLIARNTGKKVLGDGKTIKSMGYAKRLSENPGIPGPILEYYEGDSVTIDLWNVSQGAPHTIHLHGLDVDQQNDGVPHLSYAVEHMKHGIYKFIAPHPGTYLYHCHVVSAIHVQGGMYGLIIIKPKNETNKTWSNGYSYVNDYNFLFSEIDTIWHHDSVMDHSTNHMHVTLPEYKPSYFLSNGLSGNQLISQNINLLKDSQTYVRLANIGYYGNRITWPSNVEVTIIDSDGRALPSAYNSDSLYIFPGERFGCLLKASTDVTDSFRVEYLDMNTLKVKGNLFLKYAVVEDLNAGKVEVPMFEVYPNPFNQQLSVEVTNGYSSLLELKIFSMDGRLVHYTKQTGNRFIVNAELEPGTYVISVKLESGLEFQKRIIKL